MRFTCHQNLDLIKGILVASGTRMQICIENILLQLLKEFQNKMIEEVRLPS